MTRVYSALNPADAHLMRGHLEANGIAAAVQGEALWGARGELPFTPDTAPSVWVADEDAEQARALVANYQGRINPTHCAHCGYNLTGLPEPRCPECGQPFRRYEPWTCPTCGETIEGQFTECWNCARTEPPRHASGGCERP